MTNKEKFIKTTNVMLLILVILSPILLGATIGGTIWASQEIKKELDRWDAEFLLPQGEDFADFVEWLANNPDEELPDEYIEIIYYYFDYFVGEVEAKYSLAKRYSFLIGTEYKERYLGILHWCYFVGEYFIN